MVFKLISFIIVGDADMGIKTNLTVPNIARRCAQNWAQIFEAITTDHGIQSNFGDGGTNYSHLRHTGGVCVSGQHNDGLSVKYNISYHSNADVCSCVFACTLCLCSFTDPCICSPTNQGLNYFFVYCTIEYASKTSEVISPGRCCWPMIIINCYCR